MSRAQDSKLEYNWKDIQEAQRTGFEECKKKIKELLKKEISQDAYYDVIDKIEELK